MTPQDIRGTVLAALQQAAGARMALPPQAVEDSTPLAAGGLGLSSVALLQTLLLLEERHGLVFDDVAVARARFGTFGDLLEFLRASLPTQPAS